MKKSEKAVLEAASSLPASFTPTQLGEAMGYETAQASSRVAPALRALVAAGKMTKTKIAHNRATYSLVK